MEEEVTEFLGRFPYERYGHSIKGYQNGHRERQAKCAAGEIVIPISRVSDTAEPFYSRILRAWQWRNHLPYLDNYPGQLCQMQDAYI